MKLLDYTLIGLLAGMAQAASAQEPAQAPAVARPDGANSAAAAENNATSCDGVGCHSDEGLLFRLRTRSYDMPVTEGTSPASSSEALQPDRRVAMALETPGRAVAQGRFQVQLPGGGVLWATEDPNLGQPELSISAPTMAGFDGRALTRPVRFYVRNNYPRFIRGMEVAVFRASDADLVAPIARIPLEVAATSQAEWDGDLSGAGTFRAGDELAYVLRAWDDDGNRDETHARRLQLVRPEEAERGTLSLRDGVEAAHSRRFADAGQALEQSLVDDAFSGNGLAKQNIPVRGSRVRLQGRNLPEGHALRIDGDNYPVDLERKFVAEFIEPVGVHRYAVELDAGEDATLRHELEVEVSGRYFFGIGMADVTVYENGSSGAGRALAQDGRDDDILADGRLAFYAKARFAGRYLLTAQADTRERPLEDLFDGFTDADAQDVFRRLDPDLYYPTYGDDSTTWRDVDTMGRFYLRLDWDRNQALWGNFATGITGTEYAQYVRSLYGAAVSWRSRAANAWGDPGTEVRAFASESQTAPGHSEFLGTGGSLYYLRHTDVLPGSDRVVLEIRDLTTGRVERLVELVRGADYEIDELQGRILLTRPLMQVTRENLPMLSRDVPLDGFEQRLLVDYEWVSSGFDADRMAYGLRAKHWLGDHVGIGITRVQEGRSGEDYMLTGADLTLQAGKGTYLRLEHARTESTSAPVFFSDNGGLDFTRLNPEGVREGEASSVEARANLRELGWTALDWSVGGWWREVDAGYSIARQDTGEALESRGAEVLGQFTPDLGLHARYTRAERGEEALVQAQAMLEWRFSEASTLAAELRRVDEERASANAAGLLGAVRYTQRVGTALDVHGTAQFTLDDDGGAYADNDAFSIGGNYHFANLSTLGLEYTDGDRGQALQAGGEYRLSPAHSFYGSYTHSTDRTDYDPLFNPDARNGWTLGQRWRLSNQVNVFNESQFLKERAAAGLAHTFGMDFYPAVGWNAGFTLSDGELDTGAGDVDRRAISVSGGHTSPRTEWQSKLEWREDTGAEQRRQWVTTNRLSHKVNESWRLAARFNYSETEDRIDAAAGARFVEGNLGFAYRPWDGSRWGVFGRYTWLYDLATLGQIGGAQYDQKSQVFSLEGVYRIDHHWELAAKLARREGEVRMGRGAGQWADSATTFAAGQVRYELRRQWHALAEYRWLDVEDGGARRGWLVGLDRDITANLRLGAGYNFTGFSDDLTDFDYDHEGWFVNFVGTY
ncbi:MAG TPA: hypothetical protein VIG97_02270 [Luteimonas sp.]